MAKISDHTHLLIYDGECGFCRATVRWALERDEEGRIEARPFQDEDALRAAGVTREQARRAAWLVAEDGRRWRGAEATAHTLKLLPGWRWAGRLLLLPGVRWVARRVYRWVADHRGLMSRLTGLTGEGLPACGTDGADQGGADPAGRGEGKSGPDAGGGGDG